MEEYYLFSRASQSMQINLVGRGDESHHIILSSTKCEVDRSDLIMAKKVEESLL